MISSAYQTHCLARSKQQSEMFLSLEFPGISVDFILHDLVCAKAYGKLEEPEDRSEALPRYLG